jgi:hypothetical protein
MNRPKESDYTSQVAYTRALEKYCDELQEQEPVGWIDRKGNMICTKINESCRPLYTTPQPQHPEKQEQGEPVAWMYDWTTSEGEFIKDWTTSEAETLRDTEPTIISNVRPLYTHPPKREWVGLTDKERNKLWRDVVGWGDPSHDDEDLMKVLEAKLKEKNT